MEFLNVVCTQQSTGQPQRKNEMSLAAKCLEPEDIICCKISQVEAHIAQFSCIWKIVSLEAEKAQPGAGRIRNEWVRQINICCTHTKMSLGSHLLIFNNFKRLNHCGMTATLSLCYLKHLIFWGDQNILNPLS